MMINYLTKQDKNYELRKVFKSISQQINISTNKLMETNESGRAEKTFKNFGKKVDVFLDELNEAGERLEKEFKEKFEDLKNSADKIKRESENKERWKEVEASLKNAGDELGKAFKAAFRKRDDTDQHTTSE